MLSAAVQDRQVALILHSVGSIPVKAPYLPVVRRKGLVDSEEVVVERLQGIGLLPGGQFIDVLVQGEALDELHVRIGPLPAHLLPERCHGHVLVALEPEIGRAHV